MSSLSFGGFRVAIVGSCQVLGLSQWVERYLPGAAVSPFHIGSRPESTPELVASQIAGADLVITQFCSGRYGPLEFSELKLRHERVVFLPVVFFPGFHPDLINVDIKTEPLSMLHGPLDVLQSEIVVAAHGIGLPVRRVPGLFNSFVFDALGYFAVFDQAKAALIKIFAEDGYDLTEAFGSWLLEGCFMHTDNHPHIRVLGSLARMALEKVGLPLTAVPTELAPHDPLLDAIRWPILPLLARRFGSAGSAHFIRSIYAVPQGDRSLSMEAYVAATYRALDEATSARLQLWPRTQQAIKTLKLLVETRGLAAA